MVFVARPVWTYQLNSACVVLFIYICIEQWQVESRVKLTSQVCIDRATSRMEDYAIYGYIYMGKPNRRGKLVQEKVENVQICFICILDLVVLSIFMQRSTSVLSS